MKQYVLGVFIAVFFLSVSPLTHAREIVVGLSPYQDAATATRQVKSVIGFLVETLEPGDRALLFDAYHLRSLGVFVVPAKAIYANPKAKIGANRQVVAAWLQFAKQARAPHGKHEPSLTGAIRLPQTLRFVGENHPVSSESDVLILGSPLYDDHKEPEFSMVQRIPGDGHLTHARSETVFGTKGQESLLTGYRIHWGFGSEEWMQHESHAWHVKRFWSLYISRQGGQLATFSHDLATVLSRAAKGAVSRQESYVLEPTDKLEMIRLVRPPVVKHKAAIFDRPLSQDPLPAEYFHQATEVEIGITWDQPVDLDLHARPGAGAPTLSYQHTQSPEGTYYKDFTRSPRVVNGHETIAFTVPVSIAELVIAVNYFGGRTDQQVTGELRLAVDDDTFAQAFVMPAKQGNGGQGGESTIATGTPENKHWLVINPLDVVGARGNALVISGR